MPRLCAFVAVFFLAAGAQAASPSVDLVPNRPSLFMDFDPQLAPQRLVSLPLFRTDLTLNEPPEIRLTPRWIENRGIKVQLVGEDVVVIMPFVSRPKRWLTKHLRRLAGLSRKRS